MGIELRKAEIPREEMVGKNGREGSTLSVFVALIVSREFVDLEEGTLEPGGKKASCEDGMRLTWCEGVDREGPSSLLVRFWAFVRD